MAVGLWALCLCIAALGYRMEAGVYELTTKTIDEWHTEFLEHLRIVQFYAPFDMKSKDFSPQYIALQHEARSLVPEVVFAKVDVSKYENKPLIGKYQVGEFPSLVVFRAGGTSYQHYIGERKNDEILRFLRRHQFNVTAITEIEQFERIANDEYPLHGMLLAVVSSKETELAKVFTQYAKINAGKFAFGLVEDKGEFAARFDLDSDAIVVSRPVALLGKDDLATKNITKASSVEELHKEVQRTYATSISLWTRYTEDIIKAQGRPIVTLYFDLDWQRNLPHVRYMANRLRRAVESYFMYDETTNRFTFTIADRREYSKFLEQKFLYTSNILLTIVKDGNFYALQEPKFMIDNLKMRKEAITNFMDECLSGKLDPYVRSQQIPDEDYDRDVRVVVGDNFKKVILQSTKHVILLVYRNSHTESHDDKPEVQEVFAELGKHLKDSEKLLVAKVEVTLNEIPGDYLALEYPKVFFIPKDEKFRPEMFDPVGKSLDALTQFVAHNFESRRSPEL